MGEVLTATTASSVTPLGPGPSHFSVGGLFGPWDVLGDKPLASFTALFLDSSAALLYPFGQGATAQSFSHICLQVLRFEGSICSKFCITSHHCRICTASSDFGSGVKRSVIMCFFTCSKCEPSVVQKGVWNSDLFSRSTKSMVSLRWSLVKFTLRAKPHRETHKTDRCN